MIAEFGHYALVLALVLALAQSVLPMVGAHRGIRPWMALRAGPRPSRSSASSAGRLPGADRLLGALGFLRRRASTSIRIRQQPLIYKIAADLGPA